MSTHGFEVVVPFEISKGPSYLFRQVANFFNPKSFPELFLAIESRIDGRKASKISGIFNLWILVEIW